MQVENTREPEKRVHLVVDKLSVEVRSNMMKPLKKNEGCVQ